MEMVETPRVHSANEQMEIAEGKDKGWKLESLNITMAENGYSLRCEKVRQSKKSGRDYKTKNYVFEDKKELLKHVGELLEDGEDY